MNSHSLNNCQQLRHKCTSFNHTHLMLSKFGCLIRAEFIYYSANPRPFCFYLLLVTLFLSLSERMPRTWIVIKLCWISITLTKRKEILLKRLAAMNSKSDTKVLIKQSLFVPCKWICWLKYSDSSHAIANLIDTLLGTHATIRRPIRCFPPTVQFSY